MILTRRFGNRSIKDGKKLCIQPLIIQKHIRFVLSAQHSQSFSDCEAYPALNEVKQDYLQLRRTPLFSEVKSLQ